MTNFDWNREEARGWYMLRAAPAALLALLALRKRLCLHRTTNSADPAPIPSPLAFRANAIDAGTQQVLTDPEAAANLLAGQGFPGRIMAKNTATGDVTVEVDGTLSGAYSLQTVAVIKCTPADPQGHPNACDPGAHAQVKAQLAAQGVQQVLFNGVAL